MVTPTLDGHGAEVVFDYLRGRKRWRNGTDAPRTAATDSEYRPAGKLRRATVPPGK